MRARLLFLGVGLAGVLVAAACSDASTAGGDSPGDAGGAADGPGATDSTTSGGPADSPNGGPDGGGPRDAGGSKDAAGGDAPPPFDATPPPGDAAYYATNFPLTENPISENGHWHHLGLDWTYVRTTPGLAFGTEDNTQAYDDSYAYLTGFPDDVQIIGVLHNSVPSGIEQESEILFRWTDAAHSAKGYEVNLNSAGAAQFVRWNGAIGDFTPLPQTGGGLGREVVSGDVFRAEIRGSTMKMFVNDVLLASCTDATYATGNPGIGLFSRFSAADESRFGFTSVVVQGL